MTEHDRALDALASISADLGRDDWVRICMSAKSAGLSFDEVQAWSAQADSFDVHDFQALWKSIKADGAVTAATLFGIAKTYGWRNGADTSPDALRQRPTAATRTTAEAPRRPGAGYDAAAVFDRCVAATYAHPYINAKRAAGVPLSSLRVVPANDILRIAGVSMAGALVVPGHSLDGKTQTLQFITASGKKLNLPNAAVTGAVHVVGDLAPGAPIYITEGVAQAWSCWQATGCAAACCFGAGNMRRVAVLLRSRDASAHLVLVPDVGKEIEAERTAREVGSLVAAMPEGWSQNSDVNDLLQRDGVDVLASVLDGARAPVAIESVADDVAGKVAEPARYKLLSGEDLHGLPSLQWRVRGVLPSVGLAAWFGASGCGKSFLALDAACAIAEGRSWFGYRVTTAPVVIVSLEGEAGLKLRAAAWESRNRRALPTNLHLVLQPFRLTDPQDVADLAAVLPAGCVLFIDTLNRAAPTSDENSSKDMGEILQGAKALQNLAAGLVVLISHRGKDASKGLRGHSSFIAAMDAAVEVVFKFGRHEWKIAKSKDGADGTKNQFLLEVEALGTDYNGDLNTSCVIARDHSVEEVRDVKLPQGGNQKIVLDALRPLFKDGRSGKPGAPPLRPCIELEASIVTASVHLTCEKSRRASRVREALTGLVGRGVLGLNEGWLWLI